MPDQFDLASEQEEKFKDIAKQYRLPEGPPATGTCYNCGDTLAEGHRWCNAECRDDWTRQTGRV